MSLEILLRFFGAKPAVLQKSNNIQTLSKYFWQPMDIIDFRIKEEKYKIHHGHKTFSK